MNGYQFGRIALKYSALAGISFTASVVAQISTPSFAWALLTVGSATLLASACAAILKKGDDSAAMVGVVVASGAGALIGVGEILATLSLGNAAAAILPILAAVVMLICAERIITRKQRTEVVDNELY